MNFIKCFLSFFTLITTSMMVLMAIIYSTYQYSLPNNILLQIIIASLTSSFTTALFSLIKETPGVIRYIVITFLHYMLTCGEMMFFALIFNWMDKSSVFFMPIYVLIVYICVSLISFVLYKKEADMINHALQARKADEDR